ncbi:MAG: BON domain-containing protein [Proteobacteria bacterium]|nr:BON domain-containing protein [Pseudomonadota bacterium]
MKSDADIKHDVEAELQWAPEIDPTDVAVAVSRGVVSLAGFSPSLFEKYAAERAARRVKGVAAVANDIQVRFASAGPTDPEIARAAVAALEQRMPASARDIQPVVHEGHVTLLGAAQWHYQRELAEQLMHEVAGVISVRNSIRLKPHTAVEHDIRGRIEAAFRRLAELDARQIAVDAAGSQITLRGEVRSWAERDRAHATAWSSPGVTSVRNELTVRV